MKKFFILIMALVISFGMFSISFASDGNIKEEKIESIITAIKENKFLSNKEIILYLYNLLKSTNIENKVDFEFSFLKLENEKENLIYSPLSIKYALNILNEGADGETKEQIESIIKDLSLTKYQNIKDTLSLANAVYIRNEYANNIKKEYKQTLKEEYAAEVKYDSFKNADNINKWIEDKTLGIIKNLLEDEMVQNPDTEMLLINALAINMEWEDDFDTDDTFGKSFYTEEGKEIVATTMTKTARTDATSYYKNDEITVLSMDLKKYEDTTLEFIAIMPEENLSEYINNFTMEEFNQIKSKLIPASSKEAKDGVKIYIPKFAYNFNLKLQEDLKKLGIENAFDKYKANFEKISEKPGLYVDDAIHKADIEFSEDGIRAAAVTVILMRDNAVHIEKEYIKVDINKPFMYLILDKETNEVWFVGTVYTPNLWENDKADYAPQW